jgi:opacity protein-like surface antigen
MTFKLPLGLISLAAAATAQGSMYIPNDTEASIPISWSIGVDATWDGNTTPGGANDGEESFSLNPFIGVSFVSVTPQTTLDVYARLGGIYYLDQGNAAGTDDFNGQVRLGVNLTHRFNERLRFSSSNFLSYDLEPDYAQGFASSRQGEEHFAWSTDNSIGYRWSERFATTTGLSYSGVTYPNTSNSDRFTWTAYTQFRYQLSPQSVLTSSYRRSETTANDLASDSSNQFFLVGFEHRFSPNTILVLGTGVQMRDSGGSSSSNPYLELALRTQVNTQFNVGAFVRYGVEDYDTVVVPKSVGVPVEYNERITLRIGVNASYQISPSLSIFSGLNVINTSYQSGNTLAAPRTPVVDGDEFLFNASIGASLEFTDNIFGTLTYNFTDSTSDNFGRDYDRSRVTVGVRAEF